MSTTLIGMFDSADEAAQVRQHLIQSGISAGQINTHPSSTGSTTATTDPDKSWWESLKDAFTGDDDDYETSGGTRISADHYAEGVRRGGTVLRAEVPDDRVDAAVTIMRQYNVVDIDRRASQWRESGWKGYDVNAKRFSNDEITAERARFRGTTQGTTGQAAAGQQELKVPIVEEQLAVGKRRVNQGGIRIVRRSTERPVQANVNLREEHVNVERHRVDRPLTPAEANAAMKDQKIEVTATSEVPVVSKEARVVEEVVVNKTAQERQETVRDTVKRTDVEVERTPGQETTARTDKTSTQDTTGRTQQERNRKP